MGLKEFRNKVRYYCRVTAKSQQELAKTLNLHHTTLSAKLNQLDNATLTIPEVKLIVQTLAEWHGLTHQNEVWELLSCLSYGANLFSAAEWDSSPLNQLEKTLIGSTPPSNKKINTTSPLSIKSKLPTYTNSFIGRTAELNEAIWLIVQEKMRLISLIGMGGAGKTRLSVELSHRLRQEYHLAVVFVSLANLSQPEQVIIALNETFALTPEEEPNQLLPLQIFLKNKALVIVLDNFEQIISATPLLLKLLSTTSLLQIVVTSRIELPISKQAQVEVNPFQLPNFSDYQPKTNLTNLLTNNEAVLLFAERAKISKRDFKLDQHNLTAIAELCQQLEGLPLAIELAAARIKYATPQSLQRQIAGRLALEAESGNALPARHQTLRTALQWSYDLLSAEEQTAFGQLAIFQGGATPVMLKAIGNEQNEFAPSLEYTLQWLVAKSLILPQPSLTESPRYTMLETVREFALEQLGHNHLLHFWQARHAAFFCQFAETANSELVGPKQAELVEQLHTERNNLRVALDWTITAQQSELALRLSSAMGQFWHLRGLFREGRAYLQRALDLGNSNDATLRAKAHFELGKLAYFQGDYALAYYSHAESLQIRRRLNDRQGVARCLISMGYIAACQGDYAKALADQKEALVLCRELGDQKGIANALSQLGVTAYFQEDYPAAFEYGQASLAVWQSIGDDKGISNLLSNLGEVSLHLNDFSAARQYLEKCLTIKQAIGDVQGMATAQINLATLALNEQNYKQARHLFRQSLKTRQEVGDKRGIASSLKGWGDLHYVQGHYETAFRYYSKSLKLHRHLKEKKGIIESLNSLGRAALVLRNVTEAQNYYWEAKGLLQRFESILERVNNLCGLAAIALAQQQPDQASELLQTAESIIQTRQLFIPICDRQFYLAIK